jgi:16S rRNA (uracil1498-N3)-methyltransferase
LDGAGIGYHAKIKSIEKNVSGTIKEVKPDLGENKCSVNLASALIKRDRFELMLEKATELGVNEIQPLTLERCVKKTMNFERSQKIVISSAKQCYRSRFPVLHEPINMKKLLKNSDGQFISGLMGADKSLSELELDKNVTVIIGPEGDFTENEIGQMKNAGVIFFNLGGRRLRAETAALNSLAVLNELLD